MSVFLSVKLWKKCSSAIIVRDLHDVLGLLEKWVKHQNKPNHHYLPEK